MHLSLPPTEATIGHKTLTKSPPNPFPTSQAPFPETFAAGTLWSRKIVQFPLDSGYYSSQWAFIWLEYLPANWTEAHFVGITKPLSVIMELGWNSHWWFSWKRSHLNILNHPLSTSNLFWNYTSLIWHPCPACRTASFHASGLDNRRLFLIFQRMQLSFSSLLSEELIQRANSSFPPLGWSYEKNSSAHRISA